MSRSQNPLQTAFESIQRRITKSCELTNRDPQHVRWLAISKYQPLENIQHAIDLGMTEFGENYIQELERKAEHFPNVKWVYTGQLQSNKIKKLMQYASEIQTVSSLKHAKKINEIAQEQNTTAFPIFIQINVAQEASKQGLTWEQAETLAKEIQDLPCLALQGIMALPPKTWDAVDLYQEVKHKAQAFGKGLLSIGMSNDLELAIQGGSDCLRLGTCFFGPRPQKS